MKSHLYKEPQKLQAKQYLDDVALTHFKCERLVIVENIIYLLWNENRKQKPVDPAFLLFLHSVVHCYYYELLLRTYTLNKQ